MLVGKRIVVVVQESGSSSNAQHLLNTTSTLFYDCCVTQLAQGDHIKLVSKALHKIHIEINVYFMQDF